MGKDYVSCQVQGGAQPIPGGQSKQARGILGVEGGSAQGVGSAGTSVLVLKISPVPPRTFTGLAYFSRGTVSEPPELLCTPTCGWLVFPQDNATIVWLRGPSQAGLVHFRLSS